MPLRFVGSDPAFRGGAPALASPFTSPRGKQGLCSFALISVLWKVAEPRRETQRSAPPARTVGAADAPPSPQRRHRPLAAAAPRSSSALRSPWPRRARGPRSLHATPREPLHDLPPP